MFYEVKILNPQGEIKRIISGQELTQAYWKKFYAAEENKGLNTSPVKQVPGWVKRKLDQDYGLLN